MRNILAGMALGAVVACGAQAGSGAQFAAYSVDLGGGFSGTKGSPIGVTGGTIFAQNTTDPGTHVAVTEFGLGISGWGTSVVGIESSAPTMEPFTDQVLDLSLLTIAPAPGAMSGAATVNSFGGNWHRVVVGYEPIENGFSPGGTAGLWIARIAVTTGATLDLTSTVARVGFKEFASGPSGADQVTMIDVTEAGSHINASVEDARPRISYALALYTVPESHPDYEVWDVWIEGTVLHTCDGDNNLDGEVDVNDISMVLFRLGNVGPAGWSVQGDSNGDGVVDVNDISFILWRMGNPCGAAIQLGDTPIASPCLGNDDPTQSDCWADSNRDCIVDSDDYTFFVQHFDERDEQGHLVVDSNNDGINDVNDISFIHFRINQICTP